ncbi:PQQ-like domain containing protein [Elysia marginata]|uniref:PQQ-like domain containing protein n=1 Tax=Elysia marginata TaxID=1093978 RepID=A0AAV4F0Y7_9GAST|nr:PQQ-like domain containing protein [Elysia marginata]
MNHRELFDRLSNANTETDWENEDEEPAANYPSVPREQYRPSQYSSAHSIGSKKGPSSPLRSNNRLREYPQRQGPANTARGVTLSRSQYTKGNNRGNSNRRYGSGNSGRYYSPSSSGLAADDFFGIPSSSSSSSSYQRNRNRGGNGNGYYGSPYETMYPNSNDQGSGYSRGYPYKYGRSSSPRKRGSTGGKRKKLDKLKEEKKKNSDTLAARIMRKRRKRHVGPHDDGGLQRLLSTGHLAPPTLPETHPDYNSTIDLVFATYWFFPAKTQAILPEDRKCIAEKLAQEGDVRFDPESKFYQMDHGQYEEAVTELCLQKSDHELPDDGVYTNSDDEYNPFDVNMGQMTVYRLRLKFSCTQPINASEPNTKCASVLPFAQQKWAGYMGSNGDSHWTVPYL